MKKLIFALATLFAMGMYSCGNSETTTDVTDSIDSITVDSTIVDSVVVDSAAIDTTNCSC